MAKSDWLPTGDGPLQTFSVNFSAKITAAPTSYGLVAADATALAALVTAYNSALAAATNPSTRTKGTVAAKNTAKGQLVTSIRILAKRIQANPAVTAQQKTDLGLPIHAVTPTPNPAPGTNPIISITERGIRSHVIRLADVLTPSKRAKPAGVQGAEVYSFVPPTPDAEVPADLEKWRFEGMATKPDFEVDYDEEDVGKTAYIVARWYNAKGESGPVSSPITGVVAA